MLDPHIIITNNKKDSYMIYLINDLLYMLTWIIYLFINAILVYAYYFIL